MQARVVCSSRGRRACDLQQQPLLCSALLRAALHSTHGVRRWTSSWSQSQSARTASDSLSYLVSVWLRSVKGAGSATGDMLYNIEPATTVEQSPARAARWRPCIHLPTSLRTLQSQLQSQSQRQTRQGQLKGTKTGAGARLAGRNVCGQSGYFGLRTPIR